MISETLQYSLTFITEQTTLYCSIFFSLLQLVSFIFFIHSPVLNKKSCINIAMFKAIINQKTT